MKNHKCVFLTISLVIISILSGCIDKSQDQTVMKDEEVKQLENELNTYKEEVKKLQEQLDKEEEIYFLRNQLDMISYNIFSSFIHDEKDKITQHLSEKTSLKDYEIITETDSAKEAYNLKWIKDDANKIDYIRQRGYDLSDDGQSFSSIYEIKYRPDDKGEFQLKVVVVKFIKEQDSWRVYQLFDDI